MAPSQVTKSFCSFGYDILTILISIADVTTDIIVLLDFYEKDRMVFFGISLGILILAQCSYSFAFTTRFETFDSWPVIIACICFCCILPFGTFVAFCIYFAGQDGCFSDFLHNSLGLDTSSLYFDNPKDSEFAKWIKQKLDKHLGFILEAAIEAFPQSLLQIIAIVYFQEANYISIISILLSMFSVMTKSLILSQGLEKFTFIWTWLCVVTDFFGIFFTLTWVFYSNDLIHGEFLGYFNIFGQIWIWKFFISVLIPVGLGIIAAVIYSIVGAFVLIKEDGGCWAIGWICAGLCFGPILLCLGVVAACLGGEVFCYTLFAVFIYEYCTERIVDYDSHDSVININWMVRFISSAPKNERVLRIVAINHGLYDIIARTDLADVIEYADKVHKKGGVKRLKMIKYKDIRKRSWNPEAANFIPEFFGGIKKEIIDSYHDVTTSGGCCSGVFDFLYLIVHCSAVFVLVPVFLISKVVQIMYPWIILIYLVIMGILTEVHVFQLVMLIVYICLQLILLPLGVYVMRINWWIWHIYPGIDYIDFGKYTELRKYSRRWYEDVAWLPIVVQIVEERFGNDIAIIIMEYAKYMEIDQV